MDKKASLSKTKKAQIVILHKEGFSFKKVYCSKTAVYQATAKFQNFGLYHDKKKNGRPREASLVMTT